MKLLIKYFNNTQISNQIFDIKKTYENTQKKIQIFSKDFEKVKKIE